MKFLNYLQRLDYIVQTLFQNQGYVEVACDYEPDGDPFIITQHLLEDGDKNSIMNPIRNIVTLQAIANITQGTSDGTL